MEFTAQQIADFLKGSIVGDPLTQVNDFSRIEDGRPGTLTFLANPKYEHFIYETNASIVLVNNDFTPTDKIKATLIKVPNAYSSLATLMSLVEQAKQRQTGVDSTAFVASSATVGNNCYVGAFAYIGDNTVIGDDCRIYPGVYVGDRVSIAGNTTIYPHVSIYNGCVVGSNCIIHAGAVIGADGFGFAPDEQGEYQKIPQLGNVVIEDNVEVGANTTIDRAVIGSTIIRKGVKLDNLIMVAHNVEIGSNTVLAAQAGISGSSKVGAGCMIGGQVGLSGHITVGDKVQIGAQAGILGNVEAGARILGSPAMPARQYLRSIVIFEKLPELYRTIGQLQKEIEELKTKNNNKL
ncbi:MAG: UDP-3-O-(3-hydroxymyristoyl)glucosamine N-acyltransferase [Tannerella sp.]|jgi:UDP-3-O-[3-hydroxymyristoyl] glucosamine N-acyltransferase|nr:UDP-3-O-(3-hydroxymyristoyl)glucosamine N-acyltransferase [Tannerella sp.]